jgi:molecular chaperone DnaK
MLVKFAFHKIFKSFLFGEINMSKIVGIDLGTSNSVVALKGVSVEVLKNAEGELLTPSSVTMLPGGNGEEKLIGVTSRRVAKQYPETTVTSVKRLMGLEFEDPNILMLRESGRYSYAITTDETEPRSIRISLNNKNYSPEVISSWILEKLVTDAEKSLGEKINQAVVTVPAYFSDSQKFATRAACQMAGINLLKLLPEPTAAAISFGIDEMSPDESKSVMIFDLGGGTFDISILNIASGQFLEVTKGGDMWLGGDDIDSLIMTHCIAATEKQNTGIKIEELVQALPSSEKARFNLEFKNACEQAKIKLSTQMSVCVEVIGLLKNLQSGKLVDIEVEISRNELSEMLSPFSHRLEKISTDVLYSVGYEKDLIDMVVMVGGSSSIPAFQLKMKEIFGDAKVFVHPRPMYAIAEGAAIMAHKMASQENETTALHGILQTSAHPYYLQLANGKTLRLAERNVVLPYAHSERLQFQSASQHMARLRVLNDIDGVFETVGELWLFPDGDKPKLETSQNKQVSFDLKFEISEDNIIILTAQYNSEETGGHSSQNTSLILSRSGLAIHMRNALEKILSDAYLKENFGSEAKSLLQLSKILNSTISNLVDAKLGVVNEAAKELAQAQLTTLKKLFEMGESHFYTVYFSKFLFSLVKFSVNEKIKFEFQEVLEKAENSLMLLSNAEEIEINGEALEDFVDSTFDMPLRSAASFVFINAQTFKKDCEKLKIIIAKFAKNAGNVNENTPEKTQCEEEIFEILSNYDTEDVSRPQSFERDVVRVGV